MAFAALLLSACGGAGSGPREDWVIHSRAVFLATDLSASREAPPPDAFRLWFPYLSGDLYGPPTTGSFYEVAVAPDGSFELDLNVPHGNVLKSLQRTAFSMRGLAIAPPEARLARLLPFVLQADGIEPLGQADWIDADSRQRLMLLYVDRKARITGSVQGAGHTLIYDIQAEGPGYLWVSQTDGEGTSEWARARPARVWLAVTPPAAR